MSRDRTLLHPKMQQKACLLEDLCKKAKLNIRITETFRTVAEQNALYAQGRTKPGKIVTNAKGTDLQSAHQWGVAFDFCENVQGKEFANETFFKQVGSIGKAIGLFWGGDFKSFVDMSHFELPEFMQNNATKTLKAKYATPDKFIATWGGSSTPTLPQTVRQGSRGNDVTRLQTALNTTGLRLATDGIFGKKTLQAVKDYQRANKLSVDGIVGKKTWSKLLGCSSEMR